MICSECGYRAYLGAIYCPRCDNRFPVEQRNPWPPDPVVTAHVGSQSRPVPGKPPLGRPPAPPEVWLVAGILVPLGVVLLYPLVRYGLQLIPWLFRSELERALAALILAMFVLIGSFGTGLIAVAVLLVRGSRVGRGLAYLVSGAVAFSQLADGQTTASGTGNQGATSIIVFLACCAVILLVTVPPRARYFFSFDADRPVGVIAAAVLAAYLGADAIVAGLLLLPAGAIAGKFVAYGLLLIGVGSSLLAATRRLLARSPGARIFVSLAFLAYAMLSALFGDGLDKPAALLAFAACIGVLVMLWLVPSSAAHFAGGTHRGVVAPMTPLGLGPLPHQASATPIPPVAAPPLGWPEAPTVIEPDHGWPRT